MRLGVDADSFFDHLVESIAYDYEQALGKKLGRARLKKGLTYQKKLSAKIGKGQAATKVKVTELTRPSVYEATFTTSRGVNTIRYEIAPVEAGAGEAGAIEVTYTEGFEGSGAMMDLNQKLMSLVFSGGGKRRVKQLLRAIEAHIKQRDAEEAERDAALIGAVGAEDEETGDDAAATAAASPAQGDDAAATASANHKQQEGE